MEQCGVTQCEPDDVSLGCSRQSSLEDTKRAMLIALNELHIPWYTQHHTLVDSAARLGSYLKNFLMGLVSSMTGQEEPPEYQ